MVNTRGIVSAVDFANNLADDCLVCKPCKRALWPICTALS